MSNLSTLPKGDSAWLLRKAIERIIQQVSVLETNIGSSTTGNSANTQVIFNDNGTLRGDAAFTFVPSTDILTVTGFKTFGTTQLSTIGILYVGTIGTPKLKVDVAGTGITTITQADITGALTVDTTTLVVNPSGYADRVGILTASPTHSLDVRGIIKSNGTFTAYINPSFSGAAAIQTESSESLILAPSGQESLRCAPSGVYTFGDGAGGTRMTLNSSGNVGIGVTPSAWGGNYTAVELTKGACIWGAKNIPYTIVGANVYNDATNEKYTVSPNTAATKYLQTGGVHSWHNAVAGTINTAIPFTQAMTLDASGNLLLGTVTSPAGAKIGAIAKLSTVSLEGTAQITVSTTAVALSRVLGLGGLFFVQGVADGTGIQAWWLVAANNVTTAVIASGNTTGLVPTFTIAGSQLKMVLASGTFYATSFNITT